ncbi:MAG: Alpha/beta hydrolase family protein [Planctomycetota bacterium]|nr:Alpha/beta hydrolase family protein [Planctomycetota bacterium]
MTTRHVLTIATLLLAGCTERNDSKPPSGAARPASSTATLAEARRGFTPRITHPQPPGQPATEPPGEVFRLVKYDAPVGKLSAYLSPIPQDGTKHAAIIWITGGDCNTIDEVWTDAPPDNDQTAGAYRKAGLIMMFPSLRGGNDNPGAKETLFGEVDDVLAARDFLAKQDGIDPARIYLGGHSTGGTLALLAAEMSDKFRAIFSFGPVDNVAGYGQKLLTFDVNDRRELELRAPILWLASVKSPTFVFEGTGGNLASLQMMAQTSTNPLLHFHPVTGADHFSILAPLNGLIARKILADSGPSLNVSFDPQELNGLFAR